MYVLKKFFEKNRFIICVSIFYYLALTALTSMVMSGLDSTVVYIIKRTFYKKISFEKSFIKISFMFWGN